MTNQLTFIHAADLHLDSPFKGLANLPEHIFSEVQKSTFQAVDRLVDVAIDKKVDFVLLAGDLFDNERQSLKAQVTLRNGFERLKAHGIHVYLSYGNHDHINGNIHAIEYPENVFRFPDETVRAYTFHKNGQPAAAIYGFSYENQAVLTNKSSEYQVQDESIPFHIAMLHGSLASNTEHDTYAPFQIGDLVDRGMDYWALGHIHQRAVLKENPHVVYSGNTQGRHRKEMGEKGCYHVTLTETGADLSFIPLQSIIFSPLSLDVSGCKNIDQLEKYIKNHLEQQLKNSPQLIDLSLRSSENQLSIWENEFVIEELIDIINDLFTKQKNWQYIYKVNVHKPVMKDVAALSESDHFIGELTRQIHDNTIQPYLKELYQHRHARKYLEQLSETEQENVKQEAYDLLVNELLS